MPRAIATARDALSNNRHESAVRFERPGKAKQVLVLATEPRVKCEARSVSLLSGSNVRAERERRHCTHCLL